MRQGVDLIGMYTHGRQSLVPLSTADRVNGSLERVAGLSANNYYGEARCLSCPWSMTYGSSAVPPQALFDAAGSHSAKCPGIVLLWSNMQGQLEFFIVDGSDREDSKGRNSSG